MHAPPRGPVYAAYYTALAVIAIPGEVSQYITHTVSGMRIYVKGTRIKRIEIATSICSYDRNTFYEYACSTSEVHVNLGKAPASISPFNFVAIVILSRGKCGLSRCITRYLVSMAVTDLLVIVTAVLLNRIPGIYIPGSFMSITPVCSLSIALSHAMRDSSVWLTVAFTFDRFVAICCQKLKTRYCSEITATYVIGIICTAGCFKNIPWYFMHEPMYIIDNVPWYCKVRLARSTSILWKIFDWSSRILTPCLAFLLILMLNALTVRHILVASRARRRLREQSNGEPQTDPEMESRKKSMILLFAISSSFIVLWVSYFAQFIYMTVTDNYQLRGIFVECSNMLLLLSCCTNTFIYAVTQSKFREQFGAMMQCPLKLKRNL